MNRRASFFAAGLLIAGLFAPSASASLVETASADTYIATHMGLGGPNSNHGGDSYLYEIGTVGYQAFPLLYFDLSEYSGMTVIGSATLTLTVFGTWGPSVTQALELRPVTASWSENTVTWNSFGNAYGAALDSGSFTVSPLSTVTFTLPAGTIQGWIDNPPSNFGLLVLSSTAANNRDINFYSRAFANGPQLTFDVAPEPSTFVLLAGALMGFVALRRRRCRP